MKNGDLVYNPNAGRFPSRLLAERAAEVLKTKDWKIRLIKSHSGEHITQLAGKAAEMDKDGFFVVGGDGTVNLATRGLIGSQTALGVLPGGTANVLAQELGLPGLSWTRILALEESARRLADATIRDVDVGMCGDTPFLMWAGVGLDAFAIHHIEPRPRGEKFFANVPYAASTILQASSWHGINLMVTADQLHLSGHYLLAVISNIHLYAGGYSEISPAAFLDDGMADLWLFEGDTMADIIGRAWDLLSGRHIESEKVRHVPFRELVLESDKPLYVHVDAEPIRYLNNKIEIKVLPRHLRLMVPKETPRELFIHQNVGEEIVK